MSDSGLLIETPLYAMDMQLDLPCETADKTTDSCSSSMALETHASSSTDLDSSQELPTLPLIRPLHRTHFLQTKYLTDLGLQAMDPLYGPVSPSHQEAKDNYRRHMNRIAQPITPLDLDFIPDPVLTNMSLLHTLPFPAQELFEKAVEQVEPTQSFSNIPPASPSPPTLIEPVREPIDIDRLFDSDTDLSDHSISDQSPQFSRIALLELDSAITKTHKPRKRRASSGPLESDKVSRKTSRPRSQPPKPRVPSLQPLFPLQVPPNPFFKKGDDRSRDERDLNEDVREIQSWISSSQPLPPVTEEGVQTLGQDSPPREQSLHLLPSDSPKGGLRPHGTPGRTTMIDSSLKRQSARQLQKTTEGPHLEGETGYLQMVCKLFKNGVTHSMQAESDDNCTVCLGKGKLLCCDSCVRVFHLTCLDEPMEADTLPEFWECYPCRSKRVRFQIDVMYLYFLASSRDATQDELRV